jgi:hypothetical protein
MNPSPFLKTFQHVARKLQSALKVRQIEAHTGEWLGAAVLKLQKPAWAEAKPPSTVENPGIFFSVWIDAKSLKQHRVRYNIHALKLRHLSAYSLESRAFAAAFRAEFASVSKDRPNVSTDYGPQTLMQGWITLNEARLQEDTVNLVRRFIPLSRMIDIPLDQKRNLS